MRPSPRLLPDAQPEALRALLARRRPLIALRTAEQHRLGRAPRRLQTAIAAPIPWRQERLTSRDDDLDTTLRASPGWREREAWFRSVPGIGPGCPRPLIRDLPE